MRPGQAAVSAGRGASPFGCFFRRYRLRADRHPVQPPAPFHPLKEEIEEMRSLLHVVIDPVSSLSQVLFALEDLQHLVIQIDNARDFFTIGGLDVMLHIINERYSFTEQANSTQAPSQDQQAVLAAIPTAFNYSTVHYNLRKLQHHALWVIGSAIQNHPELQRKILQENIVASLIQLAQELMYEEEVLSNTSINNLKNSVETHIQSVFLTDPALASNHLTYFHYLEQHEKIKSKLIYTFSSLLRSFSSAQEEFVQKSGLSLLWNILSQFQPAYFPNVCSANQQGNQQLHSPVCISASEEKQLYKLWNQVRHKCISLVYDLLSDALINEPEAIKKKNIDPHNNHVFTELSSQTLKNILTGLTQNQHVFKLLGEEPMSGDSTTRSSASTASNTKTPHPWCELYPKLAQVKPPTNEENDSTPVFDLISLKIRELAFKIIALLAEEGKQLKHSLATNKNANKLLTSLYDTCIDEFQSLKSVLEDVVQQTNQWFQQEKQEATQSGQFQEDGPSFLQEIAELAQQVVKQVVEIQLE